MTTSDIDGDAVAIVDRTRSEDGPANYGREQLRAAIEGAGGSVLSVEYWTEIDGSPDLVVGTTESRVVRRLLSGSNADLSRPEGVLYRWCDTGRGDALVAAGTDERGLLYALLELAERIDADGLEALAAVEDGIEYPDNEIRGVDKILEGPIADGWFYDDDFWHYYLDRLTRARFNRFVLIAGFDTAFMSPPYPFVVDVPGYPEVTLSEEIDANREEHRAQLRRIGELCAEYGVEFLFGIWQQQPWTDYQDVLVEGLPEEGYGEYCAAGIRELLVQCPEIDGVQLRVNHESGVTDDGYATAEAFWNDIVDAVADADEERNGSVTLDVRAKGCTDAMIDYALGTGLDVTVPTKFWCESTGLPYHNTEMRSGELANLDDPNRSRRYSYADMLEKPRAYEMLYRLWVIGTNRIFVWGDPDYARRFSRAAGFGDGVGFEVTAPLGLKGGHYDIQEDWPLFEDPHLRDYEWEDERYWAFYRLFGRLGYSADLDPAVWERAFRDRFGDAADAVREGYRASGKVLPLITAFHLTDHPALTNWAELDTGGALFAEHNYNERFGDTTYDTAEPSDPGLFYRIDEYVADALDGEFRGKYTPLQVASWFDHLAEASRDAAADAESHDHPETGEFDATLLDVRMLADLAEYHAHKVRAAVELRYYRETDDAAHLPDARASALAMREAWASLAGRGDGTYHDDLVFGIGPPVADEGHWVDRLEEIDADIAELERLLDEADVECEADADRESGDVGPDSDEATVPDSGFGTGLPPSFEVDLPERHPPGEDVEVAVRASELAGAETVWLRYRHTNQLEGAFERIEMERTDRGYAATIPGEYVTPEWDLLVYVAAVDADGNAVIAPGLYHPDEPMPYRVVEVTGDRRA